MRLGDEAHVVEALADVGARRRGTSSLQPEDDLARVRAGANTPPQLAKSLARMPASIAVGTFGKDALRSGVVTARARSVPALMLPSGGCQGIDHELMRFEIRWDALRSCPCSALRSSSAGRSFAQ